ncbi:SprT-like family [Burkholderia pseudomallei]|nr:SprT-like family [Burkholderia pseudomallei]
MQHPNRESWLNFVAKRMAPMFDELSAPLPDRIRIAIGFTSAGRRGRRIGECWDNRCSEDGHFEIFIRPDLAESPDMMPMEVAAILGHELVHAAVGIPAGHGKNFRRVAKGIGLEGPMRSTTAGPRFRSALTPILAEAGPLPHGRLRSRVEREESDDGETSTAPKKQSRRHIKCVCEQCGYTARTSRKWLDQAGAPHCPLHGPMTVEDAGDVDELDEEAEEA